MWVDDPPSVSYIVDLLVGAFFANALIVASLAFVAISPPIKMPSVAWAFYITF